MMTLFLTIYKKIKKSIWVPVGGGGGGGQLRSSLPGCVSMKSREMGSF